LLSVKERLRLCAEISATGLRHTGMAPPRGLLRDDHWRRCRMNVPQSHIPTEVYLDLLGRTVPIRWDYHAMLMLVIWLVLVPLSILTIRFGKPRPTPYGIKERIELTNLAWWWFNVHKFILYVAIALAVLGAAVAVVVSRGFSGTVHAVLGLTAVVLGCLQVASSWFRGTHGGRGRLDFYMAPISPAMPLISGARLQPLAVASAARAVALPNIPTTTEAGFANSDHELWVGAFAPAATPRKIVDDLNQEIRKALEAPAVRTRLADMGASPLPISATAFGEQFKREVAVNAALVKAVGLQPGN
jgi:hypothetical protein